MEHYLFARTRQLLVNLAPRRLSTLLIAAGIAVLVLDCIWLSLSRSQDVARISHPQEVHQSADTSLAISPLPLVQQQPPAVVDKQLQARQLKKAQREVERRTKQLDRARNDYLKIRRQLAQSGFSDQYAELARDRIDEASSALADAKAELQQTEDAFSFAMKSAAPTISAK